MKDGQPGLEAMLDGLRVAVVHYGEGAEPDPGHRPHRAGHLAAMLSSNGADVARLVPSYRYWDGVQRPTSWTGTVGIEGRLVVIPTRAYANSRGVDRARSLRDFNRGASAYLEDHPDVDLVVAGFPPPGLLRAITRGAPGAGLIADIRDLWPDVLVPNGLPATLLREPAALLGRVLVRELHRADAVVAMSPTMLARAPAGVPVTRSIPLGFAAPSSGDERFWPADDERFTACFVGSMTQLFDLRSMVLGWQRFVRTRRSNRPDPRLVLVGDGQQKAMVDDLVGGDPSITATGWLVGDEVSLQMLRADVGIVPIRAGHGTTVSNKVSEYMSVGLYVLNTLIEPVGEPLDRLGLGARIDGTPMSWSGAFEAAERDLDQLRQSRSSRRAAASRHYGHELTDRLWAEVIAEVLEARASGRLARTAEAVTSR